MLRPVIVAATQFSASASTAENLDKAEYLVRQAAAQGAQIILLQEFFETLYFCKQQYPDYFALARSITNHPVINRFALLAAELGVVLPLSFFERAHNVYFNSVAVIDADGKLLGCYRKSHIPDGPGYQEKFYFSPGDTGFRVWQTRYACLGVGICWDQWFPEMARIMVLQGAELLFYPAAIGSEPPDPSWDSSGHWQRVMQGHAGANMVPLITSNRIGHEEDQDCAVCFYGSSFITDETGDLRAQAPRDTETIITARLDLEACRQRRSGWSIFRDRRPDLYTPLMTLDGYSTR